MQTYRIIGADGKEYGPVSGDQIRRWITEGRVNAQTRVSTEGAPGWKMLAEFPEFSAGSAAPGTSAPPPLTTPSLTRDASAVRGPAIAMMVTSILNMLLGIVAIARLRVVEAISANDPQFRDDPEKLQALHMLFQFLRSAWVPAAILMSLVVLIGAVRMSSLKNYAFAFTVAILAMIPCVTPCCVVGLPFGIWALVVLSRDEVKSQFR